MSHEWVILANLFLLLMGFALLSRHFEKSRVPEVMPRFLPDDWKGAFLLLVIVAVLSSFLDNIAAALIGGTMARQVFRGKVHIGYLAGHRRRLQCRRLGQRGRRHHHHHDVDRRRRARLSVVEAFIAASVAMVIFGIPAAMQQQQLLADHEGRARRAAHRMGARVSSSR